MRRGSERDSMGDTREERSKGQKKKDLEGRKGGNGARAPPTAV